MKENKVAQVRNAIKTGVFCKQWWKQLVSMLNKCKLTKEEKIMVYCKIAEGLINESVSLCKNIDDINHIKLCLDHMDNSLTGVNYIDG